MKVRFRIILLVFCMVFLVSSVFIAKAQGVSLLGDYNVKNNMDNTYSSNRFINALYYHFLDNESEMNIYNKEAFVVSQSNQNNNGVVRWTFDKKRNNFYRELLNHFNNESNIMKNDLKNSWVEMFRLLHTGTGSFGNLPINNSPNGVANRKFLLLILRTFFRDSSDLNSYDRNDGSTFLHKICQLKKPFEELIIPTCKEYILLWRHLQAVRYVSHGFVDSVRPHINLPNGHGETALDVLFYNCSIKLDLKLSIKHLLKNNSALTNAEAMEKEKAEAEAEAKITPMIKLSEENMKVNSDILGKDTCTICLDKLNNEENEVVSYNCGSAIVHWFHEKCIDLWLKKRGNSSCPICRGEIRS